MNETDLLPALRAEYARWEKLLGALTAEQVTAVTSPGRTLKDDVAHLAAWQERSIARFEAAAAGGAPDFSGWPQDLDPAEDEINEWVYARNRDTPWAEVLAGWRADSARLLRLATAVPAETLWDTERYAWLNGYALADVLLGALEHHAEHYEEVAGLFGSPA